MVAPPVQLLPSRSLVRVTNSGREQPRQATVMDLSRVSSLAAAIPVAPLNFPGTTRAPDVTRPLQHLAKPAPPSSQQPASTTSSNRPAVATRTSLKRPHLATQPSPLAKRARVVPQSAPAAAQPQYLAIMLQPGTNLSQLLQEKAQLKQENESLKQRLSLFHQLFRDKDRLASVARQLGVRVQ